MLSEHISGENCITPASRSSTGIVGEPPVVMLTTASVACLMRGRNCMNTLGSPVGRPSCGLRACRCRMAAPASAAPIACSAIWSGVTGRASDIVGVWMAPVTAQVMMTLSDVAAMAFLIFCFWIGPVSGSVAQGAPLRNSCPRFLQVRQDLCAQHLLLLGGPFAEALAGFEPKLAIRHQLFQVGRRARPRFDRR